MNKTYIPVNNNLDKALAFAPSLKPSYLSGAHIKKSQHYINTMDAVDALQKDGWRLAGVYENRNKRNRIIDKHFVQMKHPDLVSHNSKGLTELESVITLENGIYSNAGLRTHTGAYRQICANGLVGPVNVDYNINHDSKSKSQFVKMLESIFTRSREALGKFDIFKLKMMTPTELHNFAAAAAEIRFGKELVIDPMTLLQAHRVEDIGDNLWVTYNRIQENLTKSGIITDVEGNILSGTLHNPDLDLRINTKLYELAESYI